MDEEFLPNAAICPKCGGAVTADARFCKHCGGSLTAPAQPADQPMSQPTIQPTQPSAANNNQSGNRLYLWLAGGLAGVLVLALAAVWGYRNRQTATPAVAAPSQVMTEKAKQVEARILQGATLANDELAGFSSYELRVLRNVHFARYGRGYERPGLGDYFYTRPWYKPSADYNDKLLTATDKANIVVILTEENRNKATETSTAVVANGGANPGQATPQTSARIAQLEDGGQMNNAIPQPATNVEAQQEAEIFWKRIITKCGESYFWLNQADSSNVYQGKGQFKIIADGQPQHPQPLSAADRLNGVRQSGRQWVGTTTIRFAVTRQAPGRGTPPYQVEWGYQGQVWKDNLSFMPNLTMRKEDGKWTIGAKGWNADVRPIGKCSDIKNPD